MNKLLAALGAGVFLSAGALAAPADDVTAPIKQFVDGINTGNMKSVAAAYAKGEIAIIDEFAPHRWVGPKAPAQWGADFEKFAKANDVTDGTLKAADPTRSEIEGDVAYVIEPTVYSFKDHGKPVAEDGQITYTLKHGAGGWKITGWTWSSPKAHPAG